MAASIAWIGAGRVMSFTTITASRFPEATARKGGLPIGSRMARALVEWAGASGWRAVEAYAYQDLPLIYAITGTAGKRFWDKLGFRVA